jgi:hypothetical protein
LQFEKFARKRQKCEAFHLEIVPTVSLKLRRKTLYGKILRVFSPLQVTIFLVLLYNKDIEGVIINVFILILLSFFCRESPARDLSFPEHGIWPLSLCGGGQVGARL